MYSFPNWNQPVVPCPGLTIASLYAHRFLRRQVRWSGILISLRISHSLLWSSQSKALVNEAEIDVFFLELSCFFYDPVDVSNLISGSSAFSKSSLNIWNFSVHILLKPGLDNFEHYFASVWEECNCVGSLSILWHCLCLGLKWKLTFSTTVASAEFSEFAGILSAASSFRIWNNSTGIPSPPLVCS